MENKYFKRLFFKGFVSILGLAVVVGVAITYSLLFKYMQSSVKMRDPFVNQIFEDIRDMEKYEIENIKYGLYSKDFLIYNLGNSLKSSGMFCTKGSYKYNNIEVYDGHYVIARVNDKGIFFSPLLLRSRVVLKSPYTTHSSSKGIVIFSNPSDKITLEKCEYEIVFNRKYNNKVKIYAFNLRSGECIIKSEYPFIINEYSKPIDVRFLEFNLLSLVNNIDFPIQFLSLPQEKLNTFLNELKNLFGKRVEIIDMLNLNNEINGYEEIREKLSNFLFLKEEIRKNIVHQISSLNDNEKKILYDALAKGGDVKDAISQIIEKEKIEGIDKEKIYELGELIDKTSLNVNSFFSSEVMEIFNKYDDADEILKYTSSLKKEEREVLEALLDQHSLDELSRWDSSHLIDEIESKTSQLGISGVDITSIKKHINEYKKFGIDDNDLKIILDMEYEYLDINFINDMYKWSSNLYSLSELEDAYKRCVNLKKYKTLMEIMDTTEISFSPSYDVKVGYERMESFGILDGTIEIFNKEKLENVDSLLKDMGIEEKDLDKAKDILLKGKIKSVDDLKSLREIYKNLKKYDYVSIIDRMLSYPSLSDVMVKELVGNLKLSLGLSFITETCNYAVSSSRIFDFNLAMNGYAILKRNFDPERMIKISLSKDIAYKYGDVIDILPNIKDFDLIDIESCSKFLDIKKVALTLLYMSQMMKDKPPDYLSSCYYADFGEMSYDAYVYNFSNGLGIALFNAPLKKKFENYDATYYPFFDLHSKNAIFKDYEDAINNLQEHKDTLIEIRKRIKTRINEIKENEFEFETLQCGKCEFAPNPLKRIQEDELKEEVEKILQDYKNEISLEIKNVEIKEEVEDKSQSISTGCLCSDGNTNLKNLYLCKTKYIINRGGNVYLAYKYKGFEFIIVIEI